MEKLYLVCDCGEAFDTIETAKAHEDDPSNMDCIFAWEIQPESEAL